MILETATKLSLMKGINQDPSRDSEGEASHLPFRTLHQPSPEARVGCKVQTELLGVQP